MDTRKALMDAGIASAEFDARELVCAAAGLSREEFIRDRAVAAPEEAARRVADLRARRAKGEPLAYVLGEWDFNGLNFRITPDVLIPRMDTEVLADWAVHVIRERAEGGFRFLDLCCGSGCIGAALASVFPESRGVLLDVSDKAVELAAENARRLGLADRVIAVTGDVCEPPDKRLLGRFDVLVSNPPYVTREEMAKLDRSVRDYEPAGALFGGADGLHFYRAILKDWARLLRPGGFLALECGWQQARELGRMLKRQGFTGIKIVEDTAGIQRVVSAFAPEKIRRETNEEK